MQDCGPAALPDMQNAGWLPNYTSEKTRHAAWRTDGTAVVVTLLRPEPPVQTISWTVRCHAVIRSDPTTDYQEFI